MNAIDDRSWTWHRHVSSPSLAILVVVAVPARFAVRCLHSADQRPLRKVEAIFQRLWNSDLPELRSDARAQ